MAEGDSQMSPQELVALKELKNKRKFIKGQLTRIETFINNFTVDKGEQIPTRLKLCEEFWERFEDIQFQIEQIDTSDNELAERDIFMDKYCEVASSLHKLNGMSASSSRNNRISSLGVNDIKLPAIEIPTFWGSHETWLEFHDIFKAVVDSNPNLGETQKFYYLKKALKGGAADVIQSLENSSTNYTEAWKLLKETYENKKVIGLSHLDSLLGFPVMNKESGTQLRKFYNQIKKDLRALKTLDIPVENWDVILIYLFEMKLDDITRSEWKKTAPLNDFAKLDAFLTFLSHKFQRLDSDNSKKVAKSTSHEVKKSDRFLKSFVSMDKGNQVCRVCDKTNHSIKYCKRFLELTEIQKRELVQSLHLCWNCLRPGHRVQSCKSVGCRVCGKRHNSLLHPKRLISLGEKEAAHCSQVVQEINSNLTELERNIEQRDTMVEFTGHIKDLSKLMVGNESQVLLSTAIVFIEDILGNKHRCRALLDCGSMSNFMTSELWERLNLPKRKTRITITGIGHGCTEVKYLTDAVFHSRVNNIRFRDSFLLLDKISENIPSMYVDSQILQIPSGICLADEKFGDVDKVDVLLGSSIFWDLLEMEKIKLGNGGTILQNTKLGWIVTGPVTMPVNRESESKVRVCNFVSNGDLGDQLEKFWSLEEVPLVKKFTKEEEECEKSFRENTFRDSSGRFVVALPFKCGIPELGQSYDIALKRFFQLERKLTKNESIRKEYCQFISEYVEMGHASIVDVAEDDVRGHSNICYLPHHCVIKEMSLTTKLRVVFDASAATSNGLSLNNKLMVGHKLQQDIFNILVRFRTHEVVVSADVAKMYRQVLVRADHRDFQRILWRSSSEDPVRIYRLNTVTYGTASAPFLAVRALQQLGYECENEYPEISRIILTDFYMDDLLTGTTSVEGAKVIKQEISKILESGGFILRKWISNKREVLCEDEGRQGIEHYISSDSENYKILGLLWNSSRDVLRFQVNLDRLAAHERVTKRKILATVAQVFDPLGLIGPIIVRAKLLLQHLWTVKKGWDEELVGEISTSWLKFKEQIKELDSLEIPRHVFCSQVREIQIHCFSDASTLAYGACIYMQTTNSQGRYESKLLCSKSRVAPLKVISLPRLELCGALLSAKLAKVVMNSINFNVNRVIFWCDSSIVLSWIAGEPTDWVTFVANRTSEIQSLTEGFIWRHVPSADNPEDVVYEV